MLGCRRQKDVPELLDSQGEEAREKKQYENIHSYRLVRESMMERYRQHMIEQYELKKRHYEMYEKVLVSETNTSVVCNCFKKSKNNNELHLSLV